MIRFAFAVMLTAAAPAAAAPLCHDLKGLYTPCGAGRPAAAGALPDRSLPAASSARTAADTIKSAPAEPLAANPEPAPDPALAGARRATPISHARTLCRDTKGLYTPCPR